MCHEVVKISVRFSSMKSWKSCSRSHEEASSNYRSVYARRAVEV